MTSILLILTSVVLAVTGQLLMKHGMGQIGFVELEASAVIQMVGKALANIFVLLGIGCYVVSVVFWLLILSRVELSFAYPMISLGYVIVMILSWVIFRENVTLLRVIGTLTIVLGVFLISRT